jgi:glycosyltransferase involved in cell wall biosynthesis
LNDFKTFFLNSVSRCYVFSFVSIIDTTNFISFKDLSNKYNLSNKKYFFVSNQFWIHKNHIIVFEAMRYLKEKNLLNFDVYFSGNQNDYRNQNYFNQLLIFIEKYKLTDNVKILGFIERIDQLSLMKHSLCVIQPSLFEGWSTVVEDAKSLNKLVICSKLKVHIEQLNDLGIFFNPDNFIELSDKMLYVCNNNLNVDYNYPKQIVAAKKNIYKILKKIKQ